MEGAKARVREHTIALIGLMGAGKTTIGRRLAQALHMPFKDADSEIEAAAGRSISEIFEDFGEPQFRDGERRVIARLLDGPPHVLATGGGAFMHEETRDIMSQKSISVWLRADLDLLVKRVSRRNHRPLLKNRDPHTVMQALMEERYPVYAKADVIVDTNDAPHDNVVRAVIKSIDDYLSAGGNGADGNE